MSKTLEEQVQGLTAEVHTAGLETRASLMELRASLAEARLQAAEFRTDVLARLDTIAGAIADLRREVQNHTHE